MQRTCGKVVGMEPIVPTRPGPDDSIICEGGEECKRSEAYFDCSGRAWYTDEGRHAAEVEIVTNLLNREDEWVTEYCTGNSDFPSGFGCVINETSSDWPGRVRDWLEKTRGDYHGRTNFDDRMDEVVKYICKNIDGDFDCEPEYEHYEYAAYTGDGLCLYSYDIGEYEHQLEVNEYPELKVLHDKGILDDVLDDVKCDVYVSRSRRRVLNTATGHYEYIGRETYYTHYDNPYLTTYHIPGGQWHYVVSEERMEELLNDALEGGSN